MGGDHGPSAVIEAASMTLDAEKKNLYFLFFGIESKIKDEVSKYQNLSGKYEIIHTDTVISNDEKPSTALRQGKTSSMRMAIDSVSQKKSDCVVSAGNTGALMAMAKLVLKPLPGIYRPAIASIFPSMTGKTILLDLGANLVCDGENLAQFAILGSVYAKAVMGLSKPTVGILNIGSEDMKGHDSLREAAAILSEAEFPGIYKGFVEGNDIALGTVDVIVTDGFTGNVALKTAEGVGKLIGHYMREAFKSSIFAGIGYMFASGAIKRLKKKTDPRDYNGGLFLGLKGICVKSHGSSDAYAFSHAIGEAVHMVENKFNEKVATEIANLSNQESFIAQNVKVNG